MEKTKMSGPEFRAYLRKEIRKLKIKVMTTNNPEEREELKNTINAKSGLLKRLEDPMQYATQVFPEDGYEVREEETE